MFHLWMISHVTLGYISWKGKVKFSVSSRNIKPWSRTKWIGRSRIYGQIMAENSLWKLSRNYVESLGLRGSWALHTILNRMGLRSKRTEPSWRQQNLCCMIRIFLCTFGWRKQEHLCMYRSILLIEYLTIRLLKRLSQELHLRLAIWEYLVSWCTYMSQRRKGPSSILLGGRVYL